MRTFPGDIHVIPLLPCPHCGAPAEFVEEEDVMAWWARCTRCSAAMGSPDAPYSSRLDLCAEWNARVPAQQG